MVFNYKIFRYVGSERKSYGDASQVPALAGSMHHSICYVHLQCYRRVVYIPLVITPSYSLDKSCNIITQSIILPDKMAKSEQWSFSTENYFIQVDD